MINEATGSRTVDVGLSLQAHAGTIRYLGVVVDRQPRLFMIFLKIQKTVILVSCLSTGTIVMLTSWVERKSWYMKGYA